MAIAAQLRLVELQKEDLTRIDKLKAHSKQLFDMS